MLLLLIWLISLLQNINGDLTIFNTTSPEAIDSSDDDYSTLNIPFSPSLQPKIATSPNGQKNPPWQAVPLVYLYFNVIDWFWQSTTISTYNKATSFSSHDVHGGLEILLYPEVKSFEPLDSYIVSWALVAVLDQIILTNNHGQTIWDIPVFEFNNTEDNRRLGTIYTNSKSNTNVTTIETYTINSTDDSNTNIDMDVTYDSTPLDVRSMLILMFQVLWGPWKQLPGLKINPIEEIPLYFGPTETGVRMSLTLKANKDKSITLFDLTQGLKLLVRNYFVLGRYESLHGNMRLSGQPVFAEFAMWSQPREQ